MLKILRTRLRQGHRTMPYPKQPAPPLPARFAGRPAINPGACGPSCRACLDACPVDAITPVPGNQIQLDTGRCLFCQKCSRACPARAITFTGEYRLAAANRSDLIIRDRAEKTAACLSEQTRRLFGRSLKLRQVSAGGCAACEADVNVLNTIGWDLGRFGIQFVASPRHADGLLITGPVPQNMVLALQKTYEAVPSPKIVIAVGACAISGGLYHDHPETRHGAAGLLPVDLFIPGCPPHPLTILDGLLRFLGKIPE